MTNDDFLLDQLERSQRHQTRRRREDRSRRRRIFFFGGLVLVGLLVLGVPSLISHSPIARSILADTAAEYGLQADAESVRIGWITPLRITGLRVRGTAAGSDLSVDQVDAEMTVGDFLGAIGSDFGEISLRGVHLKCQVGEGTSSLEEDLAAWRQASSGDGATTGLIHIGEICVEVTDAVTGGTWQLAQSGAEVELTAQKISTEFSGVVTEPAGSGGSLQGAIEWPILSADEGAEREPWELELTSESLPLSVVSLVRRRLPHLAASLPDQVSGDATGGLRLTGAAEGAVEASLREIKIRKLTAADPSGASRLWHNQLATIDGDLLLAGDQVVGRQVTATTDFASVTFDGAFSRSLTLVGASDNPLRWLDRLDGTAAAEIDLAALQQAMPGVLPLRDEAQLLSGRIDAQVESLPNDSARRSRLVIHSDAMRARARGRNVVIEPVDITATVANDGERISAEQFQWKSTFASAVGQGDLRHGSADVEIDFGRLSAMLSPIVDLSDTSLAGAVNGGIQWSASGDDVWRLTGTGDARQLQISLPGGEVLRRGSLHGEIHAVGRWGGRSLEELTHATVRLTSSGLNLEAELVQAVTEPSPNTLLPVRVQGNGRIENLADTLAPWLPEKLHQAEGGFDINARGRFSVSAGELSVVALELTQPRVAYGERFFEQPEVKVHFDGQYRWPASDWSIRSLTVAGDAVSAAVQGEATAGQVDLEVAWRAKLERVQGSVRSRLANQPDSPVQQVGYQPGQSVRADDWLVMGDCEGRVILTGDAQAIELETHASGKDLAVVQPPKAGSRFQTVGPAPRGSTVRSAPVPGAGASGRVVWSEPNLKVDGTVRYDARSGQTMADSLQIAGDWFATTLTGDAQWNRHAGRISLNGPARLKMDEVAKRLSSLSGTEIAAEGIHETPIQIDATRSADGDVAFTVGGKLGWESGRVAGIEVGPAAVPVQLNETSVLIEPAVVPVSGGELNVGGQVHYRPGPLWMQVRPGVIAKSLRVTPEMAHRWLEYIAPLAAGATQLDGTLGAEIDEAIVVFGRPEQSRVSGRLNIEGIQMRAGPLADQVIGGIEQLKAFASGDFARPPHSGGTTLINMPAQTVDFVLANRVVSHQRLYFEVDRANVVTSGRVSLDGNLDLMAQVPLDRRWLGSDLEGLEGQPVTLPIDGTLSRPSLDSSGVRRMVQQLGAQAARATAENYLQEQLGRGLNGLGIDKLFGR